MYVCLCKGVTDKDIENAVAQGCCSLRELKANLGLGTQCGRCTGHAREVFNEASHGLVQSVVQYQSPIKVNEPLPNFDVEVCYT